MKKIAIIAGDHSGDIYGGRLAQKLKELYPGTEIFSFGGRELAQNSTQVLDLISHAVMGLAEVLTSLPKMIALLNRTVREIEHIGPDLVITIDSPDFNLRILKRLKKKYPVFYYVSPQVWAWRKERVKQIKKYVDKMVVLFRFEEEFYKKESIPALYFGHPLLDILKTVPAAPRDIIAFLPGSRRSELKKHLPLIDETIKLLKTRVPQYTFRIVRPQNIPENFYRKYIADVPVVERSARVLQEARFVLCCSGTATMELAVLNIPHLLFYKTNRLTWEIARRIVRLDYVGIVNIVAGKKVTEEFLQDAAGAQNLARYTQNILSSTKDLSRLRDNLRAVKTLLLPENHFFSFARYIGEYLKLR